MNDLRENIKLRCFFCMSNRFALPFDGYIPANGGFVVCANCGKENDVTSLLLTVKAKAKAISQNYAEELIDESIKSLKRKFRNNKFIKFK